MSRRPLVGVSVLLLAACSTSKEATKPEDSPRSTATVSAALAASDYPSMILNDGAVGYWRLGDTGLIALDAAPRRNAGTYAASYYPTGTIADSPIGNQNQPGALLAASDTSTEFFISSNPNHTPQTETNYVVVPSDPNQSPVTASISVEAWFTMTPGKIPQTYSAILSKSTANLQDGYGIYWYSNTLYFFINNKNIRVGVPPSLLGDLSKFHHVVGTYDVNTINIYYDGVLANSVSLTPNMGKGNPIYAPAAPLLIGNSFLLGWQGRIDEVAIYPNALNGFQIQSHFQAARPSGPLSRAFVAFAQDSLTFGTGDQVLGGDVGVQSITSQSGSSAQLSIGASDTLDLQRGVFASSVSLASQAQVGSVYTNTLTNSGGTLGAQHSFPPSMPPLPVVPAGTPGTANVTIGAGRTLQMTPGNYGALVVSGTARLSAGAYSFSTFVVADGGVVLGLPWANTTVRVDKSLTTGVGATIAQVSHIAGGLTIGVAGTDSPAPAVSIGANNQFVGVLNAPHGTVSVGDGTSVTGALSARALRLGNNVTLAFDAPAADQCTNVTDGTTCVGATQRALCEAGACVDVACPTASTGANGATTFSVSGDYGHGTTTFTTISVPPSGPAAAGGPFPTTTADVEVAGQSVIHIVGNGQRINGKTELTVDYGAGSGIRHIDLFNDGTNITGTVDGHALVPFPVSSANSASAYAFQDGTAIPTITVDTGILASAVGIAAAASAALRTCGPASSQLLLGPSSGPPVPPPVTPGTVNTTAKDPTVNAQCNNCLSICNDIYHACDTGSSSSCTNSVLGGLAGALGATATGNPVAGVAGAIAVILGGCSSGGHDACVSSQSACYGACLIPGEPCCPKGCGNGCCDQAQTCLDPRAMLCCDVGFSTCLGPTNSSCFDPGRAFCLPSGQACLNGVLPCGEGFASVCCESGICPDGECLPQASFGLSVSVTGTQEGASVCSNGTGFNPNIPVTIQYEGVPGKSNPLILAQKPTTDGSGSFAFSDHSLDTFSLNTCDTGQLTSQVTVRAIDPSHSSSTTATFPAAFFCRNGNTAGSFGGVCR